MLSYEIKKENKVFIYWHDKRIKILSGKHSESFLEKIQGLEGMKAQQFMAKVTGNIKRKKDETSETIVIRGTHYTKERALLKTEEAPIL